MAYLSLDAGMLESYGMSGSFFALFGVYAWGSQKLLKEKRQVVTPLQSKLDELD